MHSPRVLIVKETWHASFGRRTKGLVRYPFRIASVGTAAFMLASAWPEQHRWLVRGALSRPSLMSRPVTRHLVHQTRRDSPCCLKSLCPIPHAHPQVHQWLLLTAIAGAQAAASAAWATVYCVRVWHHNHGEGWPDAESDLRHGWSAWDHMGRRYSMLAREGPLFTSYTLGLALYMRLLVAGGNRCMPAKLEPALSQPQRRTV